MLDTHRAVETPEGVALHLRPAGPVARAIAWGADAFLRALVLIALSSLLTFAGKFGLGLFLILLFLLEWFYPVLFEVYGEGATPGKRMMGLQVLNDDGTPVGWAPSLVRNLLRVVDFFPWFYTFGLLAMLANDAFKRLGDLAAGTVVVHCERPRSAAATVPATPLAPPVSLHLEEQRVLLDFAERVPRLTRARAVELAELLPRLTAARGEAALERLQRMAAWVAGRR